MKQVFADTFYWLALQNKNDNWHSKVQEYSENSLEGTRIVTTESVLIEYLNGFSEFGSYHKAVAFSTTKSILEDANITVVNQNMDLFLRGLDRYSKRTDKGYSLTDCMSMIVMEEKGLTDVLTHDHHFTQAGFNILFKG